MTVDTILLIVASFLVLAIVIIELVKIIRGKRPTIGPITIAFLLLILLFAAFLTYRASELKSADLAQIILMIALVAVTAFATLSASRQANASVEMAEEMKKQRVMASRPLLLQKSVHEKDIWEGSTKDYYSHFEISNVGNGPAIEVESSLMDNEGNRSHSIRQTYLRNDDPPIKFRPDNILNLEENKTYYLVCEYQDIFSYGPQKSLYQTRLPFKISKSSEEGKIYMIAGELESKEVTEKERIDAFGRRSKPK